MSSAGEDQRRPNLWQRLMADVRRGKFPGSHRLRQEAWLLRARVRALFVRPRHADREIHTFVIWSRALDAYGAILHDIEGHFLIRDVFRVSWSKEEFSRSMARFYGGLLPPNAEKEEHCGTDPFMVVVVEDDRPRYGPRRSPKASVNIRMFDAKQRYRSWTGGGHRIHASVDPVEAEHDLFLLLGRRAEDYLQVEGRWTGEVGEVQELAGTGGWRDIDELVTAIGVATRSQRLPPAAHATPGLRMVVENRVRAVLTADARPHFSRLNSRLHDVTVAGEPIVLELLRRGDRPGSDLKGRVRGRAQASASNMRRLAGGRKGAPAALILLYHRVANAEVDPFRLCVSPELFEQQLRLVRASWPVVSLEEVVDGVVASVPRERPVVVVTFDDGYADNLEVAQPIASALEVPVTVFVTGEPILTGERFWWDELVALLWQPADGPHTVTVKVAGRVRSFPLFTEAQRVKACAELHRRLRPLEKSERTAVLDGIAAQVPEHPLPGEGRPLTTAELERLGALPGVTVGAHTMQHRALSSLSASERLAELRESRRFVANTIGRRVDFFSYPFGRARDVGSDSRRAVAEAGYRAACTTVQEPVRIGQSHYALPRLTVYDEPPETLLRRVTELLAR
jgi:peptidoglycan/xylan/chitin deacetylase (PgdA/CDA1 family)